MLWPKPRHCRGIYYLFYFKAKILFYRIVFCNCICLSLKNYVPRVKLISLEFWICWFLTITLLIRNDVTFGSFWSVAPMHRQIATYVAAPLMLISNASIWQENRKFAGTLCALSRHHVVPSPNWESLWLRHQKSIKHSN